MNDSNPRGELRNTVYRTQTRSSRRMTGWRRIGYRLAVPIIIAIVQLFWRSCRVRVVLGAEHLRTAASGGAVIPCYWHQHQLFCGKYLLDEAVHGLKLGFLISPSVDGELGAMVVGRLGGHVIRGSSTHTGARALRDYFDALKKLGVSPAITPDGPRGPRFQFKPGAILLAQMSGRPIIPLAYAASRAWFVHWDRFVIPWPFARIAIAIGEPQFIARTQSGDALAANQDRLGQLLRSLYLDARSALIAKTR
ncbi:MAG: lysophospholipid acyltransferase family protein [Steroidobacteraceae bacterium]